MPEPHADESKDHYIPRCIEYLVSNEGKTPKQAAGQCYGMWESRKQLQPRLSQEFKQLIKDLTNLDQNQVDPKPGITVQFDL